MKMILKKKGYSAFEASGICEIFGLMRDDKEQLITDTVKEVGKTSPKTISEFLHNHIQFFAKPS